MNRVETATDDLLTKLWFIAGKLDPAVREDIASIIVALRAALSTAGAAEPMAWVFELANARNTETDEPCNWGKPQLSFTPPSAGKYQRNVRALYECACGATCQDIGGGRCRYERENLQIVDRKNSL
jgi:hypothetical protein